MHPNELTLATLPDNRLQVRHTIASGWTMTEYVAGRAYKTTTRVTWEEAQRFIQGYAGVITCNHLVARALAGGRFSITEQESSNEAT